MKLWIAVVLGGVFASMLAQAGPITFNFTGTVTQVPIDDLATRIQSLDSITGTFTFDFSVVERPGRNTGVTPDSPIPQLR